MIAVWIGGMFGALLYELFFSLFVDDNRTLGIWLTISICAVLVSIASLFLFDHAVIIGSSIAGSYIMLRVRYHISLTNSIGIFLIC